MDAEQKFREAVRHVRYDGVHVEQPDHEGFVQICGRVHVDQLEIVASAVREWLDASTYKPDIEGKQKRDRL